MIVHYMCLCSFVVLTVLDIHLQGLVLYVCLAGLKGIASL